MDEEYISHYGVKRRSGRYPWGSGDEPYQRGSENTVNGIARKLDDRDLVGASKSLGISSKKMSNVMSDQTYTRFGDMLFKGNSTNFSIIDTSDSSYDPLTGLDVPSYHGQPSSPDRKPSNIPSDVKWDEDKQMWRSAATVAYWDRDTEKWVTDGTMPYSHLYYDEIRNKWLTEDGKIFSEGSKYDDEGTGERHRHEDIPENAKWNSAEKRWEINVPDPPTVRTNAETGEKEAVVWDEYTQSFVPAEWNKKTKRWEPVAISKQASNLFVKNKQRRQTKTVKKESGILNTLRSALGKMGSFFKRKISDIIDKFDD